MDLFRLLLNKNNGSFNSIVLLMNEVVRKIVTDIHVVSSSIHFNSASYSLSVDS